MNGRRTLPAKRRRALIYSAGRFEVRPQERRLLHDGEPLVLGARAFDLLMALIERRERVVSKEELLAVAWPGVTVEENNLTVQISALRKALGADSVATVFGRGYRLSLLVEESSDPATPPSSPTPHNLPAERSSFIGREPQISAMRQLLAAHRLLTLTGIGGGGKTRLALTVAALEAPRFRDGVFFVDLAPVSNAQFVVQTAAQACGLAAGDSPSGSPLTLTDRLVTALAPRQCLLVVDNCEHLLDACAELIDALLRQCPHLVVLATSREALALDGEQVLAVPPLALPLGAPDGEEPDSVRLFAERAQAANAAFVLDAQTRWPVAEICRRLDGIPLAIEFAAARAAHLSASEIAMRLDDRLKLLVGGRRRIGRHQTLAATLDWSHELLSEPEQAAFRRLAVCAGGFTIGVAEAIVADTPVTRADVLDLIASLVAKSLVTTSTDDVGETRYRLLETVRLYAAEKLEAAGETAEVRARYRDAWIGWLEATPLERLMLDVGAIAAVARELDHLRAAAAACLVDDRPDLLARLASPLAGFCLTGNWYRTALGFLEQALTQPHRLSVHECVACHAALLPMTLLANDLNAALAHAECGVEASGERVGGFETMAFAYRGFARSMRGSLPGAGPDAIAAVRQDASRAAAMSETMPAAWRAFFQTIAADSEINLGDHEAASRWAQAAVDHCEQADRSLWVLGSALTKLTSALHFLGRSEPALTAALRALDEFSIPAFSRQAMADGWTVELAPALYAGGRRDLAGEVLTRGALAMRRNGVDLAPNQFLGVAGVVEYLRGEHARAACLLGAARSVGGADLAVMGFRTPASMALYRHYLPLLREALAPEQARIHRDAGRAMTLDEAFAYALQGIARM